MASQRVRLSKKLFMSLKHGQYIMNNLVPQKYEEISDNLETQWKKWRGINGNIVNIYDSKEECLRDWWAFNSPSTLESKSKAVYEGKLSKSIFMDSPNGHFLLFTQEPFDYLELQKDREKQWLEFRHYNGLCIRIFKNNVDCVNAKNDAYNQLMT